MITDDTKTISKRKSTTDSDIKDKSDAKMQKTNTNAMPADWYSALKNEVESEYFRQMIKKIKLEMEKFTIYPPIDDWYTFMGCAIDNIKVVIIGQDPYHGPGQAHGLCFSVRVGVPLPRSLKNIYKEMQSDLGNDFHVPSHGCLESWVSQGVLLLNATLTVRKSEPNSHAKYGWDKFTSAIISILNKRSNIVFMLWGGFAKKKGASLNQVENPNQNRHLILTAAHPSPLGANKGGWFGCKHFSKANEYLIEKGIEPINWNSLEDS